MLDTTLCHLIRGRRILLKKATRGVSRGRWNALGGKIDKGESAEESAVREVWEESGIKVGKLERCGTIRFYRGSRRSLFVKMHLFLGTEFEGRGRHTDEGRLRWFSLGRIPYREMWDDDNYWLDLFLRGYRFDADFVYDRGMEKVVGFEMRNIWKGSSSFKE